MRSIMVAAGAALCAGVALATVPHEAGAGTAAVQAAAPGEPCVLGGGLRARCGVIAVREDRSRSGGRMIPLRYVILPATGGPAEGAVFILAGGPGQAATRGAAGYAQWTVRARRDIVMFDQRGTGDSNGLTCTVYGAGGDMQAYFEGFLPEAVVRRCRDEVLKHADPRHYTTASMVADMDAVRSTLGYERIDLYGVSYGTRAALAYMRAHPARVRSAVLQSSTAMGHLMPLPFAEDAQRALDLLFRECTADTQCRADYPDLAAKFEEVLQRVRRVPQQARVTQPGGATAAVRIGTASFVEAIRKMMYTPSGAVDVLRVIDRAHRGDFSPLADFVLRDQRSIAGSISLGLYLSLTCAEDVRFIDAAAAKTAAASSFFGDARLRQHLAACAQWPTADVPSSFHDAVTADVPVLILSGEWDPVTPPRWGARAAATLPRAVHVVVPRAGHSLGGMQGTACLHAAVQQFIERAGGAVDAACLAGIRLPPFPRPD